MKKIILLTLLSSCTFTPRFHQNPVVISVNSNSDHCVYGLSVEDGGDTYYIKDTCGKFNIGDKLKVIKDE